MAYVRETFSLPQSAVGMVFVASGIGCFLTSFFSGRMAQAFGIGMLLTGSTALVAIAMFGFAATPVWVFFIACALIHGLGSGGIDAGLNGYAAHHLSARHMNWLHACFCFGAMLGPLLMTAVLTSGRQYSAGYTLVGMVLLALSTMFLFTRSQWGKASAVPSDAAPRATPAEALRHPTVVLQIAVFFVYTGLEVALSQWAFTVLTESRGVQQGPAGIAVGTYWASIGVRRVVFGLVAGRIGIDSLLRSCLLAAAAGALLFAIPLTVRGSKAVFTGSGGTTIADENGMLSAFGFLPAINASGRFAFEASLDAAASGIFTGSGGPTTTIVDDRWNVHFLSARFLLKGTNSLSSLGRRTKAYVGSR